MNAIWAEIETLIRARYSLLYLVTSEEARAVEGLREVANRRRKKLYEWSVTTGLAPAGASIQSAAQRQSPTREPLAALDQVIDLVEPAIFVFKDLHPFLTRAHAPVVRRLKEITLQLKHSYKTVVVVSPVLEIPVELEKEAMALSLPLPDREELEELLGRIEREVGEMRPAETRLGAEERERLLQAARGLTLGEAENVLAKVLVKHEELGSGSIREVLAEKQQIIRKNGLLEYCPPEETLAEVGGLKALKEWFRKRRAAFGREAQAFGLPAPRGVLLLGVQGCGKSLCAKAVASFWELPLLRFDMGRMFGSLVGSSEENVRRAIAVAESVAPAVLWVDEIDKALTGVQGSSWTDAGTTARVFGTFLTWLSEKSAPVFVICTANDLSPLPPELLRKGRLDEIFFVDLPSAQEREEIFRIHLARRGRDPGGYRIEDLAAASIEYSGAEIEQAVISALYDAYDGGRELTSEDVLEAMRQTVCLARTMDEPIRRLREWARGRARHASGDGGCAVGPGRAS